MFKKAFSTVAVLGGLALATPSEAALYTFSLTDGGESSHTSVVKNSGPLTLTITAKGYNSDLGSTYKVYKDGTNPRGYGVSTGRFDNDEIDGSGDEALVFSFSQSVRLVSVTFVDGDHNYDFSNGDDVDVMKGNLTNIVDNVQIEDEDLDGLVDFNLGSSALWAFGANGSDETFYIRNITVEIAETPTTAVPEPASLGLFAAGLIGLGAARRRKGTRA